MVSVDVGFCRWYPVRWFAAVVVATPDIAVRGPFYGHMWVKFTL